MFAKWIEQDGRFAFSFTDNGGVEITQSELISIKQDEESGKIIEPDVDGFPVAVDPPAPPEPTQSELAEMVRTERNRRAVCAFDAKAKYERQQQNAAQDPPIISDAPMTAEEYREVLDYIESLMQIPQQSGFPWAGPDDADCPWPTKPACVSDCSIL